MEHKTGLILTGGGARAAYQVGVLNALSMILLEAGWPVHSNPFPIICGTRPGPSTAPRWPAAPTTSAKPCAS
jgi:NTE family protein